MLKLALHAVLLSYLGVQAKSPSRQEFVLHSRRETVPQDFTKLGPAPIDHALTFHLGLFQGNIAGLEERLMAVSTPSSPEYGRFLSKEQVEAYVAPNKDTVDSINGFLSAHGLTAAQASPAGDTLSITVPVWKANEMFNTQFHLFKHNTTNSESIRTLEYSIPASLTRHLQYVHPTTVFPQALRALPITTAPVPKNIPFGPASSSDEPPSFCKAVISPACLQSMYGIPTTPAHEASNILAVSGYTQEYASEADLTLFLESFRPDLPSNTSFALQTLDGGQNPQDQAAGLEANLDIQYTVGVASGVPTVYVSVGNQTQDGLFGFLDLANDLLSQESPPRVLSTSYGDNEKNIDPTLFGKLCNAYLQLGARGTSVLYSSGDGGVSGILPGTTCTEFVPTFPAGCPYITSVGGTQHIPEVAAYLSSGGFSNIYPRPAYQNAAIASYLSSIGDVNEGLYNASGRGFPDVSAQALNILTVINGNGISIGGTSASSPIFASVIALLNDELVANGRSPLGFLNPFLYSAGRSALNDITSGSNPGCNTNGFNASAGWDPVTGLGTPNYAKLRTVLGL